MRTGESLHFIDRLLALRQNHDVFPWFEQWETSVVAGSAAGQAATTPWKLDYDVLFSEFTCAGLEQYDNGGTPAFGYMPFDFSWKVMQDGLWKDRTKRAFDSRATIGHWGYDWLRLGRGYHLPKGIEMGLAISTTNAVQAGGIGARIYVAGRGYRLWSKRAITPPQLTLKEHREAGRVLTPFTEGIVLSVPVSIASDPNAVDYTFEEDVALTQIQMVAIPDSASLLPANNAHDVMMQARIVPDYPIMRSTVAGWCNRFALCGATPDTVWDFPLPVTVKAGTQWSFNARQIVAGAVASSLQIVMTGYRLSPERR